MLARKILKGRGELNKLNNYKKRICTFLVLLNFGLTRRIKVVAWSENLYLRYEVN